MSNPAVPELLTSGQVAAVLHRSSRTINRWAQSGELPSLGRVAVGNGAFIFDPEVVKQKALDLALGRDHGQQLDLELDKAS